MSISMYSLYSARTSRIIQLYQCCFYAYSHVLHFMRQPSLMYTAFKGPYQKNCAAQSLCDSSMPWSIDTPFLILQRRTARDLIYQKTDTYVTGKVVERAIADSFHKKKISVYNPYIRAFHVLAKIVPHQWILFIMRFLK